MELRRLRKSDMERFWELDSYAFHVAADKSEWFQRWRNPDDFTGAFEGDRLVAVAGAYHLGQFFGGRSVPMAGITGVSVAPDCRGRGLARLVTKAVVESARERGDAISSLFPATTSLYRELGWELSGTHQWRSLSPRFLLGLPRPSAAVARLGSEADHAEVRACYDRLAPQVNGFLDRPETSWLARFDAFAGRSLYLAENPAGEVEGYLIYRQLDGEWSGLGGPFQLAVEDAVATTRDAALALWRLVGSWATQVDRVVYRAPAEDPLLLLLPQQDLSSLAEVRWMTRVLDPVRAVAARGFPPGVEAEVQLALHDGLFPDAGGAFVLVVGKGEGRLEVGGGGRVALDVGAFSSLYTGWAGTGTLDRAGRIRGGTAEDRALLDAAFSGETPWMLDEF